jgi:5'(3')-deoxyribonucleotidase
VKCLLDMDGVLADFVTGICMSLGVENPYYKTSSIGEFDMVKLLGIPEAHFWSQCDYDFWLGLRKMDYADRYVDLLVDRFGAQNICILSSPSENRGCVDAKKAWIRNHYPQLTKHLFGNAKEFCGSPHHVLIDDYDKNVNKFRAERGHAFLPPRIWNSRHAETRDEIELLGEFLERL